MDELLSLFDADPPTGTDQGSDHRGGDARSGGTTTEAAAGARSGAASVDAFGAAFGGEKERGGGARSRAPPGTAAPASRPHRTRAPPVRKTAASAAKGDAGSRDPAIGLRVVDRRTSRSDAADAFSSFTYRSCSVVAAASRAEWTAHYLVDGGGDKGGGRTCLATCGILTNEPSSRLSKAGRAFAVLSLGDLPSGARAVGSAPSHSNNGVVASISVLLFGDALSALRTETKYLRPGWAVAVLGPTLLPPRDGDASGGGGTSVTLSVNDPRQILAIGRAADCDRCRGTVRVRVSNDYGGSSWEDVRCKTLVDARLGGGYCQMHRRQGLSSCANAGTGKRGGGGDGSMTFMQRQRMQSLPQSRKTNTGNGIHVRAGSNAGQASSRLGTGRLGPSALSEALSRSGLLEPAPASLPPVQKTQLLKRAPLHMKKLPSATSRSDNNIIPASASTKAFKAENPYLKDKTGQRSQGFAATKRKEAKDILGEALERKRARSGDLQTIKSTTLKQAPSGKRPCKVFNPEGYDGAVQVPKPSKLLFRRPAPAPMATPSPVDNRLTVDSARTILEKQKNVAALLRQERGDVASSLAGTTNRRALDKESLARSKRKILVNGQVRSLPQTQSRRPKSFARAEKANDFASAFGSAATGGSSDQPLDREAIFRARSRFASEAGAQEYARARAAVQELEAREDSKEGNKNSNKKDGKSKPTPAIATSGWACRTCGRTTPYKPASCVRARHDVRQRREIRGTAKGSGTRKERLDRHGRDAEEGGLTLGSGLEWDGWRGEVG